MEPLAAVRTRERVLRTVRPNADESLNGLLLRISEANGYERPGWLLELAQAPGNAVSASAALDDLAYAIRQPVAVLQERAYRNPALKTRAYLTFFGKPVRNYHIEHRGVRVCPRCLEKSGYCRALWDIRLVTTCPEHDCGLLDICPGCQKPITWARRNVAVCDCGCDWRTVKSMPADPKIVELAAVIHGASGFPVRRKINREQWSWLRRAQLIDILDAAYIFGAYARSRDRSVTKLLSSHRSTAGIQTILTDAAEVLCDWPAGFHRFLDRMRVTRSTEAKTGIISEFGEFYSALHRRFAKRRLGFLQKAFQDYLTRNWDGGYTKPQARWARPSGNTTFVGRPEVARILGISPQTVDVLLREGELEGETRPMGMSRSFAVVTRSSLGDYQKRRSHIIESEKAAQLLGISRRTYRELVKAGIVKANCGRIAHRPRKAYEVDRRLIDGLLSRLESQIIPGFSGAVLDYRTAVERFGPKHQGNVGLLKATLSRRISVGALDKGEIGLRRLRFDEQSINDFLSRTTKTDPAISPVSGNTILITNPPFGTGG